MTTVINTPGNNTGDSSSLSMIAIVLFTLVLATLFFIYALPQIQGADDAKKTEIKIELPTPIPAPTPAP